MEVQVLWTYGFNFALLTGLVVLVIAFQKYKSTQHKHFPPGPRGLEALRGILKGILHDSLGMRAQVWNQQYGELVLCQSILGNILFLNSARLVKELYSSKELEQFTNYRPLSFAGKYVFQNYSDVVTASADIRPEWPKLRKVFHQTLKIYGEGMDRIDSAVQSELQRLVGELEGRHGQDTDVHSVMSNSVLRVGLILVTGESPEPSLVTEATRYNELSNELFSAIVNTVLTSCPWLRFIPFLPYRKLCLDLIKSRDRLLMELFTRARDTFDGGQPRGILDALLTEQRKEDNQWLTDDHIRGAVLNTIGSTHVNNTQVVIVLLLRLIHNQDVMRKAQKEIDDLLGEQTPQMQHRNKLPYTEAVVLETLRMVSPLSLSFPHRTSKDISLDGYTLPKGVTVFSNPRAFQYNSEIYSDPKTFRPERFLDDAGQLLPASHPIRQSILIFGVGKRSCPGVNFSMSRIFLYLVTLLQKFDVLPPKHHSLLHIVQSSYKNGTASQLKPYHAIFRSRSH